MGVAIGLVFSGAMVLAWLLVGDRAWTVKCFVLGLGAIRPHRCEHLHRSNAFWTVGNSVLEEYVFRWFLVEKGEVLFGS